jgi:hypothetical protein
MVSERDVKLYLEDRVNSKSVMKFYNNNQKQGATK